LLIVKVFNTSGYKNSNCLVGFSDVDSAISVVDELDQRVMIYNYRVTVSYSSRKYYGYNKGHGGYQRRNGAGGAGGSVHRRRGASRDDHGNSNSGRDHPIEYEGHNQDQKDYQGQDRYQYQR
jgi:hypothetical protein